MPEPPPGTACVRARLSYKHDTRRPGEALMRGISEVTKEEYRSFQAPVDDVPVYDGRAWREGLGLDSAGFDFADDYSTACRDFYDRDHVREVYYPEVEEYLRRRIGAAFAICAGHQARDQGAQVTKGGTELSLPDVKQTVKKGILGVERNPHTDFTSDYHDRFVAYLTPGAGAPRFQAFVDPSEPFLLRRIDALRAAGVDPARSRIVVVNVWRATRSFPLLRDPLAVCDARSVRHDDLIPVNFPVYAGVTLAKGSAFYSAKHSARHRWRYFPRMGPTEVLMLKTFDSRQDMWPTQLHTSFDDPTTPEGAPPRTSAEARVLCFFPDATVGAAPEARRATPAPRL